MKDLIKKIGIGIWISIGASAIVYVGLSSTVNLMQDIAYKKVLKELDANKDGLSEEEIKKFYDKTGLSLYRKESLRGLSKKDLEKYLYYDNDSKFLGK